MSASFIGGETVGRLPAPGVDVIAPKVDAFRSGAAIEVIRKLYSSIIVIRRISNAHGSVFFADNISFHVTNGGFDKSACSGVVGGVRNFIAGKEANGVRIVRKGVDDTGISVVYFFVPFRRISVNRHGRLAKVRYDIDAGICEHLHTLRVIFRRINSIDANGIRLQPL